MLIKALMKRQRQRETRKMNQASMKTDKLSIQRVKSGLKIERKLEATYVGCGLQSLMTHMKIITNLLGEA